MNKYTSQFQGGNLDKKKIFIFYKTECGPHPVKETMFTFLFYFMLDSQWYPLPKYGNNLVFRSKNY